MINIFAKFFNNFTFKALYVMMGKADPRVLQCQCKTLDIYKQMSFYMYIKLFVFNTMALKSNCYHSQINKFKCREGNETYERFLLTHFLIPLFIVHNLKNTWFEYQLNQIYEQHTSTRLKQHFRCKNVEILTQKKQTRTPFIYAFCEICYVYRCQLYMFQEINDNIE